MSNRGRDRFNVEADDVRSDRRQREIEQVVDRLIRFRPTKVAVEVLPEQANQLQGEYGNYQAGRFDLSSDEVYQLGFRIAARSGHERLYPINVMVSRDIDPFQWAETHGQAKLVEPMTRQWQALVDEEQGWLRSGSVMEVLRRLNAPDQARQEQALYLLQAHIGEDDAYPGVDWLVGWYERNLKIFANLTRISEPEDRIFVLYGSGHIPLLRQFIQDSSVYDLEEAGAYLE